MSLRSPITSPTLPGNIASTFFPKAPGASLSTPIATGLVLISGVWACFKMVATTQRTQQQWHQSLQDLKIDVQAGRSHDAAIKAAIEATSSEDNRARVLGLELFVTLIAQAHSRSYEPALAAAERELARQDPSNHREAYRILYALMGQRRDISSRRGVEAVDRLLAAGIAAMNQLLAVEAPSPNQRFWMLVLCEQMIRQEHGPSYPLAIRLAERELAHPDASNRGRAYRILNTLVGKGHQPSYDPAFTAAEQSLTLEAPLPDDRIEPLHLFTSLMRKRHAPSYTSVLTAAERALAHYDTSTHVTASQLLHELVSKQHTPSYGPALAYAQHALAHPNVSNHLHQSTHHKASWILTELIANRYTPSYEPAFAAVQQARNPILDHAILGNLLAVHSDLASKQHILSYQPALVYAQHALGRPDTAFSCNRSMHQVAYGILNTLVANKYTFSYAPACAAAQKGRETDKFKGQCGEILDTLLRVQLLN